MRWRSGARLQGGVEKKSFWRVPDRGEAIRLGVHLAEPGDTLVACGKGHEQSMCFGITEYPWDDRVAIRAALSELLQYRWPGNALSANTRKMMVNDLWKTPVTLEGHSVRLEPLTEAHVPALTAVGRDERIWKFMVYGQIRTEADMRLGTQPAEMGRRPERICHLRLSTWLQAGWPERPGTWKSARLTGAWRSVVHGMDWSSSIRLSIPNVNTCFSGMRLKH